MINYNKAKIERALNDLYEEGLKGYKPEYRDGLNRFEAIGKAVGVEVVLTKIED